MSEHTDPARDLTPEQRSRLIRAANSAWEGGAQSVSALVNDMEAVVADLLAEQRQGIAAAIRAEAALADLRTRVRALADDLRREADALCPVGEYDKADKAWRAATVRRRCADALRALLDTEADQLTALLTEDGAR